MSLTVQQTAKALEVDPATVRKWICRGCPCVRRGRRGPGNGARLDLEAVTAWRGRAATSAEPTTDETLERIASALWEALDQDKADLRAHIKKSEAAAVLFVAWDRLCKAFGKTFPFDRHPDPIRALGREL